MLICYWNFYELLFSYISYTFINNFNRSHVKEIKITNELKDFLRTTDSFPFLLLFASVTRLLESKFVFAASLKLVSSSVFEKFPSFDFISLWQWQQIKIKIYISALISRLGYINEALYKYSLVGKCKNNKKCLNKISRKNIQTLNCS